MNEISKNVIDKVKSELMIKHDKNTNPNVFSPWSFDAGVVASNDETIRLQVEIEKLKIELQASRIHSIYGNCPACELEYCCSGSIQSECGCMGHPTGVHSTDKCGPDCFVKLSEEKDRLQSALENERRKLKEIAAEFDHKNMRLLGWHMNSDAVVMSDFFEQNDWYASDDTNKEKKQ